MRCSPFSSLFERATVTQWITGDANTAKLRKNQSARPFGRSIIASKDSRDDFRHF